MHFLGRRGFTGHWVGTGVACPAVLIWVTTYLFPFGDLKPPTQCTVLIPCSWPPWTSEVMVSFRPGLSQSFWAQWWAQWQTHDKLPQVESVPELWLKILNKGLVLCPKILKLWTLSPEQLMVFALTVGEGACLRMRLTERKVGLEQEFPDNPMGALGSHFAWNGLYSHASQFHELISYFCLLNIVWVTVTCNLKSWGKQPPRACSEILFLFLPKRSSPYLQNFHHLNFVLGS